MNEEAKPPVEPMRTTAQTKYGPMAITWELELLLSGAVVFALLQLPGSLDRLWLRLQPQATEGMLTVITLGYFYAKAIIYSLITAFILNLVGRAYWVGLVGLDSVFPKGVNWGDSAKTAPIGTSVMQRRLPTLPVMIERVDNFCSILYSVAFLIVYVFLLSTFFGGIAGGVAWLIAKAFLHGRHTGRIAFGLLLLFVGLPMIPALWDRLGKGKIQPGSPTWRRIERGIELGTSIQGMRLYGTSMMTLFTNVPKKIFLPAFYLAAFGMLMLVMPGMLRNGEPLQLRGEYYVPDVMGSRGGFTENYESRWPEGLHPAIPSIQTDMITDPYVRLTIPYTASRANEAVRRLCPDVKPFHGAGFKLLSTKELPPPDSTMQSALRCLGGIYAVTLDGRPIGSDYRYHRDHDGTASLVAYIPTAGLARGAHLLVIQRPPRWEDDAPAGTKGEVRRPHYITFWM